MKQTNRGKTQILGKSKYQGKVTRFNGAEIVPSYFLTITKRNWNELVRHLDL
jgi:hypothetical protein